MLKRNELSLHEKTWRKLNNILISERSKSEKFYIRYDSSYLMFYKGKMVETIKGSGV
jgi:hypothetical protein